MFLRKQYGKAASVYEKILNLPKGGGVTDELLEKVWCSLGCIRPGCSVPRKPGIPLKRLIIAGRRDEKSWKQNVLSEPDGGGWWKEPVCLPIGEHRKAQLGEDSAEAGRQTSEGGC